MKNWIGGLLLMLLGLQSSAQRQLKGDWEGVLNAGGTLHLVFSFYTNDAGSLSAMLACPEQGFTGLRSDSVLYRGDSVVVSFRSLHAKYLGRFSQDTLIGGEWQQGMSLALNLHKTNKPTALKRPQTPTGQPLYNTGDVSYFSKDHSIRFTGTITEPQKGKLFPAILLITGSGQQDRDETLFGHKPFLVLADYLTNRGYIVLRVDDRGMGGTTGDFIHATSKDFAEDVSAGIDFLRTLPEVDINRIGLLGHSEGGIIAPMVAQMRHDISFMVLLAAPGVDGITLMTAQNEAILQSIGLPKKNVDAYQSFYRSMLQVIANTPDSVQARKEVDALLIQWRDTTAAPIVQATTGIHDEASKKDFIDALMHTLNSDWFRYFLRYDPQPALEAYRGKLLALNGSRDIQVPSKLNLAYINAAIAKNKRAGQEAKELPGLNHLFQTCHACTFNEYGVLEETFAPSALQTIGNWLDAHVKTH